MNKKRKLWIAGGVLVLLMAIGGTTAVAVIGDDGPLTGETLKKASAAALEAAGGGTVTDTESGDEDGAYEVEVTMADGSQVDVHLDSDFKFIAPMPSILHEILWPSTASTRRMPLTLVPPLTTRDEPLTFRSLITVTLSPSLSTFPWASLTL